MDDDDLIVVDDDLSQPSAVPSTPTAGPSSGLRHSLRRRATPPPYAAQMEEPSDTTLRRTRSSVFRNRPQPKLKLKLSDKAAAQAPGMSFLGAYDRELDSDDEDLVFEEQFVLRMPPGDDCEKLRKMVATREIGNDVWFKFKGACWFETWMLLVSGRGHRFSARSVPYWRQSVLRQARRLAMHN